MRWPALPGRTNHLEAGVLVPLVWDDRPRLLAILRSRHLRRHSGEVAFPGGKPEAQDVDIRATALREAREELGFDAIDVIGRLSSVPLYTSDFRLEPLVGLVSDAALVADPGEVAEVLPIDVREWLGRPQWEGAPFEMHGEHHLSPVFDLDGHVMYGGTAYVLLEALTVLAGAIGVDVPPMTGRRFTADDILARALRNAGE